MCNPKNSLYIHLIKMCIHAMNTLLPLWKQFCSNAVEQYGTGITKCSPSSVFLKIITQISEKTCNFYYVVIVCSKICTLALSCSSRRKDFLQASYHHHPHFYTIAISYHSCTKYKEGIINYYAAGPTISYHNFSMCMYILKTVWVCRQGCIDSCDCHKEFIFR